MPSRRQSSLKVASTLGELQEQQRSGSFAETRSNSAVLDAMASDRGEASSTFGAGITNYDWSGSRASSPEPLEAAPVEVAGKFDARPDIKGNPVIMGSGKQVTDPAAQELAPNDA